MVFAMEIPKKINCHFSSEMDWYRRHGNSQQNFAGFCCGNSQEKCHFALNRRHGNSFFFLLVFVILLGIPIFYTFQEETPIEGTGIPICFKHLSKLGI